MMSCIAPIRYSLSDEPSTAVSLIGTENRISQDEPLDLSTQASVDRARPSGRHRRSSSINIATVLARRSTRRRTSQPQPTSHSISTLPIIQPQTYWNPYGSSSRCFRISLSNPRQQVTSLLALSSAPRPATPPFDDTENSTSVILTATRAAIDDEATEAAIAASLATHAVEEGRWIAGPVPTALPAGLGPISRPVRNTADAGTGAETSPCSSLESTGSRSSWHSVRSPPAPSSPAGHPTVPNRTSAAPMARTVSPTRASASASASAIDRSSLRQTQTRPFARLHSASIPSPETLSFSPVEPTPTPQHQVRLVSLPLVLPPDYSAVVQHPAPADRPVRLHNHHQSRSNSLSLLDTSPIGNRHSQRRLTDRPTAAPTATASATLTKALAWLDPSRAERGPLRKMPIWAR